MRQAWIIVISMDGRGRAFDNIFVERLWRSVKHEDVYLKGYATVGELMIGLTEYFDFYNDRRPHQSLENETPDVVYRTAIGGGAMILDKYPRAGKDEKSEAEAQKAPISNVKIEGKGKGKGKAKSGQRRPAASEVECTA